MNASPTTDAGRARPFEWVALGAIVLAGLALRVFEAGRAPMWFDEIYTTWAARGGFAQVLATIARDVHPPFHTLLVSAWASLGGESAGWLRSLSVLFGVANIFVLFLLARATFGRRAGLVAAALLALHPVHAYFSQESRVYALLWLELTTVWWLAWRWLEGGRARDGLAYVAVAALALYTHYLSGLVLVFTAAGGLAVCLAAPNGRRRALEWAGLHLAVAALFAPQVPTFLVQKSRLAGGHWIALADARDLRDWVRHLLANSLPMLPLAIALGAHALASPERRRPAVFLSWSAAGPVLFAWWLGSRGAFVFSERYMFFALPPLIAVVAGGFDAFTGWWRGRRGPVKLLPWALLAALLAFEQRPIGWSWPVDEAKALAEASARIREEARPGDLVFCADTHALLFLAHYEPGLSVRLLWFEPDIPYFEGDIVIPDSLRCGPEDFAAAGTRGNRWWGVRVRKGGSNGPRAEAMFDSAGAGPPRRFRETKVWGPK